MRQTKRKMRSKKRELKRMGRLMRCQYYAGVREKIGSSVVDDGHYVFNVNDIPEDKHLCKAARDSEYCTLMEYNTCDLILVPPNCKIVGSKWVGTIKQDVL
jgi:hypothetical protein